MGCWGNGSNALSTPDPADPEEGLWARWGSQLYPHYPALGAQQATPRPGASLQIPYVRLCERTANKALCTSLPSHKAHLLRTRSKGFQEVPPGTTSAFQRPASEQSPEALTLGPDSWEDPQVSGPEPSPNLQRPGHYPGCPHPSHAGKVDAANWAHLPAAPARVSPMWGPGEACSPRTKTPARPDHPAPAWRPSEPAAPWAHPANPSRERVNNRAFPLPPAIALPH